jgi:hypothetical protein
MGKMHCPGPSDKAKKHLLRNVHKGDELERIIHQGVAGARRPITTGLAGVQTNVSSAKPRSGDGNLDWFDEEKNFALRASFQSSVGSRISGRVTGRGWRVPAQRFFGQTAGD